MTIRKPAYSHLQAILQRSLNGVKAIGRLL
jgi:hypothetical protein